MKRISIFMGLLITILLMLVACSSTKEETTASVSTNPEDVLAAKRSEPLSPNSGFHNDAAVLVGNTGKPQFIEFYTEW